MAALRGKEMAVDAGSEAVILGLPLPDQSRRLKLLRTGVAATSNLCRCS